MICLIGLSRDPTIMHTIAAAEYFGIKYTFFDLSKFSRIGEYEWDFHKNCGFISDGENKLQFPNSQITGIYVRLIDTSFRNKKSERKLMSVRVQAIAAILRIIDLNVINRPAHDISNSSKVYHLQILKSCGFRIPPSLLTNSECFIKDYLKPNEEYIFKGSSSEKTIVSKLNKKDKDRFFALKESPVLFQRFIKGYDIRSHLIGGKFYTELIKSEGVDYRFSKDKKYFDEIELPEKVQENCLKYKEISGLDFIGFDFKVTNENEYYIMEANPMPGYESYDRRAKYKISNTLFDELKIKKEEKRPTTLHTRQ